MADAGVNCCCVGAWLVVVVVRGGSSVYWKVAAVKTGGLPAGFVRVLMVRGATPSALSNMAVDVGSMEDSGMPSAESGICR